MAYHYTQFGLYGEGLRRYADLHGMVPQEGDKPDEFSWPHTEFECDFDDAGDGYEGYAAEQWEEHLAGAIAATEEANAELQKWREANV